MNQTKRKGAASLLLNVKRYWPLYVMFIPGAIYMIINNYMPMAGLVVAFKQYNARKGIFGSPFIGLKNFEFLFKTPDAYVITRNTILYNVVFIVLNITLSVIFAIMITDTAKKFLQKTYQSMILFPYLMSSVILSYIVFAFLSSDNGIMNNSILPALGMSKINWYSEPKYWPFILVFVNAWKGVGYGCLIFISNINSIDLELYEAADLDGASRLQKIKYITMPFLKTSIITLVLVNVGHIFYSDFGLFYQVPRNSGLLFPTTNVIDTYVYRGLMENNNIGMSAAAGFYQSVVGFVIVILANWIVGKFDEDSTLF